MAEVGVAVRCPRPRCEPGHLVSPEGPPLHTTCGPHLLWSSSCPGQSWAGFIECLTGHYQSDITCMARLSLLPRPRSNQRLMSGRRNIHCHARLSSATRDENLGCGCFVMELSSLIHKDGPPCGLLMCAGQLFSVYIAQSLLAQYVSSHLHARPNKSVIVSQWHRSRHSRQVDLEMAQYNTMSDMLVSL